MSIFTSVFAPLAALLYISLIGWRLTRYFGPLSKITGLSMASAPLLGILALIPPLFIFICATTLVFPGDKAFTASLVIFLVLAILYEGTHILRQPSRGVLSWRKILHKLTASIRRNPLLLVFLVFAFVVSAYPFIDSLHFEDGNLVMSGSMWSDLSARLGFIQNFAQGGNYPPENFAFPGKFLTYHFLYDFFIAVIVKLGADLVYVLNLTTIYFFVLIAVFSFYCGQLFFKNSWVGIVAFVFLCFGSSLVFFNEIFVKHTSLSSLISYQGWLQNTTFETWGLFNFNVFINQRHLTLGLAAFLLTAYLLFSYSFARASKRESVGVGLLIGALPFFHMSVAQSLVILAGSLFVLSSNRKALLLTIGVAIAMLVPQVLLWKLGNEYLTGYPRFHFGYEAGTLNPVTFISYYVKVFGVKFILFFLGFLLCDRRAKLLFLSALPIFIFPNVLQMSGTLYDNNKFIIVWLLIANLYAALPVIYIWQKTLWHKFAAVVLVVVSCATGVVDYFGVTRIGTASLPYARDELRTWIEQSTVPNSVFLTDYKIYHSYRPFFSVQMAGRRLYVHEEVALQDMSLREMNVRSILENNDKQAICRLLLKEKIDYIVHDPELYDRIDLKQALFPLNRFKIVFDRNGIKVISVQDSCLPPQLSP